MTREEMIAQLESVADGLVRDNYPAWGAHRVRSVLAALSSAPPDLERALDSQYRAGAKAGWNAAQSDTPHEDIARLIAVHAGDLRHAPPVAETPYVAVRMNIAEPASPVVAPAPVVETVTVTLTRKELRRLEWAADALCEGEETCPACHAGRSEGKHDARCWIAAALSTGDPTGGGR